MQKTLMSKKLLALLLIVTLLPASLAFAKEDEKAENEVLKLSLEDAIKLAEENNQQVKLSELALEKAKLERQQYRHQDKRIRDAIDSWEQMTPEEKADMDLEEYMTRLGEYEALSSFDTSSQMDLLDKKTEVYLKLAEAGIDVTIRGIRFGVEAAYYGAISARDNRLLAEAAVER
ncbi:MAG: hypothetical protein WBI37_10345, partial [Tepidanaerobacteraceae bacterium]